MGSDAPIFEPCIVSNAVLLQELLSENARRDRISSRPTETKDTHFAASVVDLLRSRIDHPRYRQ